MAVNHFIQHIPGRYNSEQALLEDLLEEMIQWYGMDVVYIVRESESQVDLIYGEDPSSKFQKTFTMEMYMQNYSDHAAGGDIFTRMGLQITEASNLIVARKTFKRYVPTEVATRPREGDLIWVPLLGNLYEIKYVDHETNYHALGRDVKLPYIYQLQCILYTYGQEKMDTGIEDIDRIEIENAYRIDLSMADGVGDYQLGELVYQGANVAFATSTGRIVDWQPNTRTLSIVDVTGDFMAAANVVGQTSQTSRSLTTFNPLADSVPNDMADNEPLASSANASIIRTERNPFGTV